MHALEASGVEVRFGAVRALDRVSLELARGEVHAILGGNGAGKSTLLRVFSGARLPDRGEVRLDGKACFWLSPREAARHGVALVTQELELLPALTVAENILLERSPARFGFLNWRSMRRQAREVLARMGISIDERAILGTLPASMRQLVAVARGMALEPTVLLLDEPTASLDAAEAGVVLAAASRLAKRGVAVALVTHLLEQAERVSDRMSVLCDGRVVGSRPAREWRRDELVAAIAGGRVAAPAGAAPAAVTPARAASAAPIVILRGAGRRGAIESADLEVRRGDLLGLAGLLGSGRSELLRLLCGADPLDRGEMLLEGRPLRWRSPRQAVRRGVGLTPEDRRSDGIIHSLTVAENIILVRQVRRGWWRRIAGTALRRIIDAEITALGIKARASQPAGELSGGNQQKVLLARWRCAEPLLLALDEPTRGIDVIGKAEVRAISRRLADAGVAVIFASVELDEVADLCTRIVALRDRRTLGEVATPIDEAGLLRAVAGGAP